MLTLLIGKNSRPQVQTDLTSTRVILRDLWTSRPPEQMHSPAFSCAPLLGEALVTQGDHLSPWVHRALCSVPTAPSGYASP